MKVNLFKYCPPKYRNTFNLDFFEKSSIFFQKPANFNDPFDCKIPNLKIKKKRKELKSLNSTMLKSQPPEEVSKIWNSLNRWPTSKIQTQLTKTFIKAIDKQRNNMGIYSTSLVPDSELIWSHYSMSHTGYMLHFELDLHNYMRKPIISGVIPIPVIYSKIRNRISIDQYYTDREKTMFDLIRTKSNAWQYEYELRLIHPKKSGFIKLPDEFLKSIVAGANIDPNLKTELSKISSNLSIPLYSANVDTNEYRINIPGLEVNRTNGIETYKELLASKILDL